MAAYPCLCLVLFSTSEPANSQAVALAAIAPIAVNLDVDPKIMIAFLLACYGYFILPTYASDLACIGIDQSATTHIDKFVINHRQLHHSRADRCRLCRGGWLIVKIFF